MTDLPDPEATEFSSIEDVGSVGLGDVGLGTVLADDGLGVAPPADEDLVHGVDLGGLGAQGDVRIVVGAHPELEVARVVGDETVLELVLGL